MLRVLAFAVLLLVAGPAPADSYSFGSFRLGKGYVGPLVVDVSWADGSARPVAAVTGTITVYTGAGAVLWTKALAPAGIPSNRLMCQLSALETAPPGNYYSEISLSETGVIDALHGSAIIEGR